MATRDPGELVEKLGAVMRHIRVDAAQAYAALGLGATQAKFLRYIGRNPGASQADLARATLSDPALTGRVLDTLAAHGWVRRKRSLEDRRQYVLELSAEGKRLHARVNAAREVVVRRIAAVIDDRDIEDFDRIAKKILGLVAAEDSR